MAAIRSYNSQQLKQLEEKLARYKKIFLDKKRNFRGVKHESAISELRYTEFMVYKNIVEGLKREITKLKITHLPGSNLHH